MTFFSISVIEVALVVLVAFCTGSLALLRLAVWKWFAVTTVAFALAAAVTPADPLSTLLMAILLLAFFAGGLFSQSLFHNAKEDRNQTITHGKTN